MSAFTGDSAEREESGWPAPGLLTSPLKRVCFVLCLLRSLGPAVMPRRCWSELSERRVSDVKPCCRDCRPARAPPWGATPHVGPPHVMAASVCRGLCRRPPVRPHHVLTSRNRNESWLRHKPLVCSSSSPWASPEPSGSLAGWPGQKDREKGAINKKGSKGNSGFNKGALVFLC